MAMAYEYEFDRVRNYALFVHEDELDFADVVAGFKRLFAEPEFEAGVNVLRDMSGSFFPENIAYDYLENMYANEKGWIEDSLGDCRVAWVVGSPEDFAVLHRWLVRDRLSTVPQDRKTFRRLEDARRWLGLS
ncbi:MAG: hypothetical protein CMM10_09935 [Rhodospirillaceae bacterium]|jgi:hypothetical protein|nr:hypothetical protein [Rhodospirillaceae bacterium]